MMATKYTITACANCGKGEDGSGDINLKDCMACKMVKYCNRECQLSHRPKHKKECKKRADELLDTALFKQPPPNEDCPICMLPMPIYPYDRRYQSCCGKNICEGCMTHVQITGKSLCPFCRVPVPTCEEEDNERIEKRMKVNDADAFFILGTLYHQGSDSLKRNDEKAMELMFRAAELGSNNALNNIGSAYTHGDIGGVPRNLSKAKHYYQLGSMGGDVMARHSLGVVETMLGNHNRAMKHWIIGAKAGGDESLDSVKKGYMRGDVTKEDYASCLRAHKESQDEMKSVQRDYATRMRVPMEEFLS